MALRLIILTTLIFGGSVLCLAQQDKGESAVVRTSAAYAEILLRKVELQSDIEAFSADYTETNPKLIDAKFELGAIDKEMERLNGVRPSDAAKLTQALGKLVVRKAAIATDYNRLVRSYNKEHPDVR